jgi:hypothetical protein
MGNELGKLLGRDFFIGFFLPALFFCGGNWLLWEYLNHPTELGAHAKEIGQNALLTGIAVWIFAILLQAVNRQLFRLAEGYWPGRSWLAWRQRRRFRSLRTRLDRLKKERATAQEKNEEFSKMSQLMRSWHKLVVHFPSDEAAIYRRDSEMSPRHTKITHVRFTVSNQPAVGVAFRSFSPNNLRLFWRRIEHK